MIHALTMGHIDPDAVGQRKAIVRQPLDMGIVERLLGELGEIATSCQPSLTARVMELV
jgi:hypothetical protein